MSAANAAQGFGANATVMGTTQSIRESHTLTDTHTYTHTLTDTHSHTHTLMDTHTLILALQCTYTLACSAMIMSI